MTPAKIKTRNTGYSLEYFHDSKKGHIVRIHRAKRGRTWERELDLPMDLVSDLTEDLLDWLYGGTAPERKPGELYDGMLVKFKGSSDKKPWIRVLRPNKTRPHLWDGFYHPDSHDWNNNPKQYGAQGKTTAQILESYDPL